MRASCAAVRGSREGSAFLGPAGVGKPARVVRLHGSGWGKCASRHPSEQLRSRSSPTQYSGAATTCRDSGHVTAIQTRPAPDQPALVHAEQLRQGCSSASLAAPWCRGPGSIAARVGCNLVSNLAPKSSPLFGRAVMTWSHALSPHPQTPPQTPHLFCYPPGNRHQESKRQA